MADPSAPILTVYQTGQGTVTGPQLNTFEQTCDNLGQLRDFTGVPGVQVFLRGYITPGDGGQGSFYWDATATGPDNGTTIIVPTGAVSGAWIRLPNTFTGGTFTLTGGLIFCGDGGGSAITTGVLRPGLCPFACTLTSWTLQAEQAGNLVLDIWALAFANDSLPTVTNSITGGNYPTLAGNSQIQSTNLTGWTTPLAANAAMMINVRSVATIQKATLTLGYSRTVTF